MIEKIIGLIIRFRFPLIGILLAGLILMGFQITKIKIDNSLDVWFLKDDPVLVNYRNFQKQFGNDETITVVFSDSVSIVSQENIYLIQQLMTDIAQLPMIKNVYSVVNALNREDFLSKDGKTTIMYVELQSIEDIDEHRNTILTNVQSVLDEHFKPLNRQYHLAGIGVVYDTLNQISLKDSSLFITLSYLLILLILALFIRRFVYIVLAVIIILCAVVFTMGIFQTAGKSVNMVTMVLPTLIMIFGVADVIHIINTYSRVVRKSPNHTKRELIVHSISSITLPCFLTSVTTAIGFASLIITKMQVIQDLGIFASIGILIAFCLSIILSSIAFSFFKTPRFAGEKEKSSNFLQSLSKFVLSNKKAILIVSTIIFILFVIGIFRIRVDTYSIQFLKSNHRVRRDSDYIEETFGFYTPIEFTLEAPEGAFLMPENLLKVKNVERVIENEPLIDVVFSLPDFIPSLADLKDSNEVSAFIKHIPEDQLQRIVNSDYSYLRITGRAKMLSAAGFEKLINNVMKKTDEMNIHAFKMKADGYWPLYVKMMEYITKTQVSSFALAFIIIFMIIAIYAGSLKLGILAILPNLFPLAITLGIMGWCGIRLDIATVTITAIAIGVIVDDTMHFLYKFKEEARKSAVEDALRTTMHEVGWPIISTSVILTLGFLILMFAQIKSICYFGMLSAIVISSALLGDLLILPALILSYIKRSKHEK